MRKVIIIVLALAIVLGFLFWRFGPSALDLTKTKEDKNKPVTLNFWGLWEDENLLKPAFDAYKKTNPKITINYKFQNSTHFRNRVQTQLSANEGPDIFIIHNSWLPMFLKGDFLSDMPSKVMTLDEYSQAFYPIIKDSFTQNGKIYAIPRGIDGLALYYNEDILKGVGIKDPPQTWIELRSSAIATTVIDSSGKIKTAGVALGTTGNVDHWPEIIGLLFLQQPEANLEMPDAPSTVKPDSYPGADIIKFYTSFITDPKKKTWDVNLELSTQAFAAGKLAFYFAPSWRAHELRVMNPQLNFKTAPVPRLNKDIGWATFWGYAVSQKSPNQTQAWEFLKFLTSVQTQQLLYQEAAKIRLFGLPYSRVELASEIEADPIAGSFVKQAQDYKFWYLESKTFDEGINDNIIKYYEDAINAVVQGKQDPKNALAATTKGVKQVLDEYKSAPIK